MSTIEETLSERGKEYGEFMGHACIAQQLKRTMRANDKFDRMSDDKKEALDMIAHKIARILNGNPSNTDSWHDIAGYAKLVEDNIIKNGR